MDRTLIVLPSARAIRHEQLLIESDTLFLPNYITMNEFISKLCLIEDFKTLDDDTRVSLLLKASDFKQFSELKIQRNFFAFTKNSSYIFKFFEELSGEMFDISQLQSSDIYGEYEEHIAILQQLYKNYEDICNQKKLIDKIFVPKLYKFNKNYLKSYKHIELKIDGYLTNFEIKLLQECCNYSEVTIIFTTSRFNKKMQDKFLELGIKLEKNYTYKISLNKKEIISKIPRKQHKNITCESFSESILQIAYIKHKVYEGIKKGYQPQQIAIVLPDENMALKLRDFDTKSNFNFAMGKAFSKTDIYKKLNSTCQALDQTSQENFARLKRVGDETYIKLLKNYHKNTHEFDILEFLKEYQKDFKNKDELKIFEEELYTFIKVIPYMNDMSIKSLLALFLQRLSKRSIDDIMGGKITVMGLLETRLVNFDLVVIVDFSDGNVPKRSDKDMFLNTKIREIANLPTTMDRENLQKHYYDMLISNAKEVAISYTRSNQSSGSVFLKQLGIKEINVHKETDYADILFEKNIPHKKDDKDIVLEYNFKNTKLSATRLKTFLECKRKYYYKYIKHINGHEIPKDMPKEYEIGNSVHLALSNLYSKKNSYNDIKNLKKDLYKELDEVCANSELDRYMIDMQKKRMEKFCTNEVARFDDGWMVQSCEEYFECNFAGAKLVGTIDRIDKKEDKLFVLDYKTGSYNLYTKNNFMDATDFQLEFYYLLASSVAKVSGCAFYDLKESTIIEEPFLNEKLEILKSHIKEILSLKEIDFCMCEDLKHCRYCDYATICERT